LSFSARYLKSEDTSLVACANCPPKKPNIEKKQKKILNIEKKKFFGHFRWSRSCFQNLAGAGAGG